MDGRGGTAVGPGGADRTRERPRGARLARVSRVPGVTVALVRAAHGGPAAAVTVVAGGLTVGAGLSWPRGVLVVLAVLAGQLSIGWSNDLLDLRRDRTVGRTDKPLATGEVTPAAVTAACATALAAAVVLSLACGPLPGLAHLVLVAAGWAYNLGVKATVWSWAPYAVAFGGLPVFVSLAGPDADVGPPAVAAAGALLGVGAHLLNVLPDLDDDEATGVRGLGHRLGARASTVLAVAALSAGSVLVALGATGLPGPVRVATLAVVGVLAAVALRGRGRVPFTAAIAIALLDVLLLVVAS